MTSAPTIDHDEAGAPVMHVGALWRYPVKSLGGEPLTAARLTADGVEGDRLVHVAGPDGLLTGRTRPGLLTLPVRTDTDGTPLVGGHPWSDPRALDLVRSRAGADAELVAHDGPERFDIGNLLVATDGAVAAFGHDVRRLRPNLVITGVSADAEPTWVGHALEVGDALIGLHAVRPRCIVTTVDPDGGEHTPGVLRWINRRFEGRLALDAWVIRPGTVRVGDPVRLVTSTARPEHLGGWISGTPYVRAPQPAGTS